MKNSMKLLRIVLASILAMAISAPTYSDQANSAFKDGVRAESQIKYDAAYEAYGRAVRLKPKDPKYMVSYLRVQALAAAEHLQKGKSLRASALNARGEDQVRLMQLAATELELVVRLPERPVVRLYRLGDAFGRTSRSPRRGAHPRHRPAESS